MEEAAIIAPNEVTEALDKGAALWRHNLPAFTNAFQSSNSERQFYAPSANVEWTTGFCTGQLWLCFEHTGEAAFREAALTQVDSFLERIEKRVDVAHHDMGFLYTPSCVAAHKLVGSETGKRAALMATDCLMERFMQKGQFFQAWGQLGAKDNYRLIIDCLMNLPLLYWASDQTGDPRYRQAALAHTQTSVRHLMREDHSTYHTFFFDPQTGEALRGVTHQGYRDGSAWARGQAWGIYGLALSYHYTNDPYCLDLFRQVTDFYLARLPKDGIPCWDLDFSDGEGQPKDSSAAAIAACGMLEMSKHLAENEAESYQDAAKKTAAALWQGYAVRAPEQSNGLLLHGVYAKASPHNPVKDRGVDECNTWGDYFWMELLTRLSKSWEMYW